MIKQNALLIERINNPKESLQLEAVSQHWSNIKYINNPTNRVKEKATNIIQEKKLDALTLTLESYSNVKVFHDFGVMLKHITNGS
jgi:hypothetical protein